MDEQLPDVGVWMVHRDLARAPAHGLPPGYRMRPYAAGDLQTWLRIQATDPFFTPSAETFAASMPGDDAYLAARVLFLADPAGEAIGTITAWSNRELLGREIGQIHWVALVTAARGLGLAKPMLSAACAALRAHGHAEACLETNTRRLPAINLYRQFGFEPHVRGEEELEAWRTIAPRLKLGI